MSRLAHVSFLTGARVLTRAQDDPSAVGVNERAAKGAVRTWKPKTKEERDQLSDNMADKAMDLLKDLPTFGKK